MILFRCKHCHDIVKDIQPVYSNTAEEEEKEIEERIRERLCDSCSSAHRLLEEDF